MELHRSEAQGPMPEKQHSMPLDFLGRLVAVVPAKYQKIVALVEPRQQL
jgi:hypothetical protein